MCLVSCSSACVWTVSVCVEMVVSVPPHVRVGLCWAVSGTSRPIARASVSIGCAMCVSCSSFLQPPGAPDVACVGCAYINLAAADCAALSCRAICPGLSGTRLSFVWSLDDAGRCACESRTEQQLWASCVLRCVAVLITTRDALCCPDEAHTEVH